MPTWLSFQGSSPDEDEVELALSLLQQFFGLFVAHSLGAVVVDLERECTFNQAISH